MFSSKELPGLKPVARLLLWKLLVASLETEEEPPIIEEFSFNENLQRIEFLAAFIGRDGFSYSLASSSPETTFGPASTAGSIVARGASNGGVNWFVTPGNATPGEVHELTLTI